MPRGPDSFNRHACCPQWHSSKRSATSGISVAMFHDGSHMDLQQQITEARERLSHIQRAHPNAIRAAMVISAMFTLLVFRGVDLARV